MRTDLEIINVDGHRIGSYLWGVYTINTGQPLSFSDDDVAFLDMYRSLKESIYQDEHSCYRRSAV